MFDWRKLQIFLKVYETKSFSQAAKELYISQPTVTIHIQELEKQLGLKLFERSTRNVIPTKVGHLFYEYGSKLWQVWTNLERELINFRDPEGGFIELGASTIPGQYILPTILRDFRNLYPKVKIFLRVTDTQDVIDRIIAGFYELGVVGAKVEHRQLVFIPCCEDEIILIAPKEYAKDEISLSELKEVPLISREPGSGTWRTVIKYLSEVGIVPSDFNIVAEMSSTSAVKSGVRVGLGLGFVSKRAVELELGLGLIKEVKIKELQVKRCFFIVHLKNKKFTPACQKFLKFLRKNLT